MPDLESCPIYTIHLLRRGQGAYTVFAGERQAIVDEASNSKLSQHILKHVGLDFLMYVYKHIEREAK